MNFLTWLLILFLLQVPASLYSQSARAFCNPVIPGDFADPSIIQADDGNYYSVGTSSEWAPFFPVYRSSDLSNWKHVSYVFKEKPSWTRSSFWAPEYYKHEGKYLMYYVARRASDGMSCIGVASSRFPDRDFKDHGIILAHGKEAIDPFIISVKGQLYMTFKAYGLENRPIEILGIKLSADGLKTAGEPFMLIKDEKRVGVEGQCIVERNGTYYILYSEGACCGPKCDYRVRVAKGNSIEGPYTHNPQPILDAGGGWKCPGHGTLVQTRDNRHFYMYHAYSQKDDVYTGRQGLMSEMFWDEQTGWPYFKEEVIDKADSLSCNPHQSFSDDFSYSSISPQWQWDFQFSNPKLQVEDGHLLLAGSISEKNKVGSAVTVRPSSGNYEIMGSVVTATNSLTGLVLYGDHQNAAGIGIKGNEVQVWEVRKGIRSLIKSVQFSSAKTVALKMRVDNGSKLRFYWSEGKNQWNEVTGPNNAPYDASFLPPWDRSPRPGLSRHGTESAPAKFDDFKLHYHSGSDPR